MKRAAVPSILIVVLLLALAVIAEAQQPMKVPRIGYLAGPSLSSAVDPHGCIPAGPARTWLRGGEKHCH